MSAILDDSQYQRYRVQVFTQLQSLNHSTAEASTPLATK